MIAAGVVGGVFLICTVVMFLGVKERDGETFLFGSESSTNVSLSAMPRVQFTHQQGVLLYDYNAACVFPRVEKTTLMMSSGLSRIRPN